MNFENIKAKMDSEKMDDNQIPTSIKNLEASKMPIQIVRRRMRNEIIITLLSIVFIFFAPRFMNIQMHPLAEGVYYISIFLLSLMTLLYLIKIGWFLNKTSNLNKGSKETVIAFINDLKLTLEVYKTAIISGSLLLPIVTITLFFGNTRLDEEIFTNLISLNLPPKTLLLYIVGYLVLATLIFGITILWSNWLYGTHIKELEKVLKEFED